MVFYRKYRPQKIEELDIFEVREKLTNILLSNNIPHAFLFSGPKGLGKTSAARILAKAINCEKISKLKSQNSNLQLKSQKEGKSGDIKNFDVEPCNECEVCLSITNGSNIDVVEIDAASNRGVDEIRALRETIKFSPVALARKIYIIDEVHMLTTEAFNALLKTLEEPPQHAVFILCTTEEWKLPQTIISRTFAFKFSKAKKEELVRSIARILKGEKLEIEAEAFDVIYSLADGSFRDAAKLIEELAFTAKDKKITKNLLEGLYGTNFLDKGIHDFIAALLKKITKKALEILADFAQKGFDFKIVTEKIVDVLRKALLKKAGLAESAEDLDIDTASLSRLIEYFSHAYRDIKNTPIASLPLELAAVRWCVVENSKLNPDSIGVKTPASPAFGEASRGEQNSKLEEKEEKATNDNKIHDNNKKETAKEKMQDVIYSTLNSPKEKLFFDTLIQEVKKDNHSIAGLLRGARLIELAENEFKLETAYKFHSDKLNDPKIKNIIEKRAGEILNREIKMSIVSKKAG